MTGDVALPGDNLSPHGGLVHEAGPSFLGRTTEVRKLSQGLQAAHAGTGGVGLVVGEPGIGKTRLASELALEAGSQGFDTAWGRCWEGEGAPVLWPWVQILQGLAFDPDELRGRLKGISPLARALFPDVDLPAAEPSGDPETDRFVLFDTVSALLRQRSATGPIFLVLDDLHDADEQSLQLLRVLSRTIRSSRLLVCGTYRGPEAELRPTVGAVLRDVGRDATVLSLAGLLEDDVARLIEHTAGSPAHPAVVRSLYEATEGNPLFVSEMVRLLIAEGQLTAHRVPEMLPIPAGVRQTIGRRLDLLSPEARSVLEVGAVFGPEFDFPPVREVAASTTELLMAALGEATATGLLHEIAGEGGRYRFSHALVRDALYAEIPFDRRRRLHLEAGRVIERRHSAAETHLAEVANHLQQALPLGEPHVAFQYGVRSARRAASLFANEEAVHRFRDALRAYEYLEDRDDRMHCELLIDLGLAENLAGLRDESRETFSQAGLEAKALEDPELLARAALGYGRESWMTGVVDWKLVGMLEEALAALGPVDSPLRVDVLTRLATELYSSDQAERRLQLSQEGLDTARRIEDPQAEIYALDAKITVTAGPDNAEDRLASGAEIMLLAGQTTRRVGLLNGRMWRVPALLEVGDPHRFRQELEAYQQEAKALRAAAHGWFTIAVAAAWSQLRGHFDEAARIALLALERGAETRGDEAHVFHTIQNFSLERERSEPEELEPLYERLLDLAHRHQAVPAYAAAAAWLAAHMGRETEARRRIGEITANGLPTIPRDLTWMATLSLLSETAVRLDETRLAGDVAELLKPYAHRFAVFDFAMACYGSTARYVGLAEFVLERWDEAVGSLEQARTANERLGAAPFVAHCERELAETLLARNGPGDRTRAAELLGSALDAYRSLGMPWYRRRTESLLQEMGLRPADADTAPARRTLAAVLGREGEYWAVVFEGDAFRLKDAKGLAYLARMLAEPGREFHALDLFTGSSAGTSTPSRDDELAVSAGETMGAALDPQAKAAYKRRLQELDEELEDAEAANDPERASKARQEREFLASEIAAAVGLGGRDRPTGSAAERARVNVTKAIRTAIGRIRPHSEALAQHLDRTIRTGIFCSYQPDPRAQVGWRITT